MWHGKSKAVYQKEIANLRSKVLSYHTTQYYSNVNEKKQQKKTKKSNILPQRKPPGSWIIC